ncbi:Uncharacterised protein [Mycobacteroides abscessus subsp. abscessus]|nr:Uncharacterised protein [Mycobacteroides abscessus subsp. abscessus]
MALGPRATKRPDSSADLRPSATPHSSAASIQPRKPMPVVATVRSGGLAMTSSVASRSSASSASGMIRMAAACTTAAPRRSNSAISSSERRAAVTPIVNPSSRRSGSLRGNRVPVSAPEHSDFDVSIDHPHLEDWQPARRIIETTPVN